MQRKLMKTGFTLVELSISIVFIAILSLAVTFVIMDTVSSYRRGLTLNQINTTGTDIVDDMMSAVQGAPAQSLKDNCGWFEASENRRFKDCQKDSERGLSFAMIIRTGKVLSKDGSKTIANGAPLYGAFCTGNYSYLWNSGYFFADEYKIENDIKAATLEGYDSGDKPFKLIKIKDEGRVACSSMLKDNNYGHNYYVMSSNPGGNTTQSKFVVEFDASNPEMSPEDLIAKESNLALYDLDVGQPAMGANDRSMLYPVSFILGTIQGGVNVTASGNNCAAPEDESMAEYENFDYCSINKFNFAAQAIGG